MTAAALSDYAKQGDQIETADGTCLFRPGDEGRAFLLVVSGVVRVEQTNSAGRTVVLYRVHAGDSCVLTTTCLLSGRPYSGHGYAEGAVKAVAISAVRFQTLMERDAAFRELVFRGFAQRVGELTDVIDALLLHRTDLKLARWLSAQTSAVVMTQQDIAQELGTAREVVSRALKSFERQGWIAVERGTITVLDAAVLGSHGRQDGV
ncbi:MAG: Crp/Fnr family transcriptional regulator [Tateyamaria sp.]